ncbi:MAG: hypothetical protein AAF628_07745 [Planctomycetota bacterium]
MRSLWTAMLLAASVQAQWASTTAPAGSPIHHEGFLVATEVAGQAKVFSAASLKWSTLGPIDAGFPSVPAVQTGQWTVLLRMDANTYRRYSARLDQFADVSFSTPPDQLTIHVEDDVILIIGTVSGGGLSACGYSAQTNQWDCVAIPGVDQMRTQRFVLGVVDSSRHLYGFSARMGVWEQPLVVGASLRLKAGRLLRRGENVLLAETEDDRAFAFSGVLGQWSLSPPVESHYVAGDNLAYVNAVEEVFGTFPTGELCAYSAYTGQWTRSGSGLGSIDMDDNVLLNRRSTSIWAFGAWPGRWDLLTTASPFPPASRWLNRDWAAVYDGSTTWAFSGICGGRWTARTILQPSVRSSSAFPRLLLVQGGAYPNRSFHAFSPIHSAWAPPIFGTGAVVQGRATALVGSTTAFYAYSARHNSWTAAPFSMPGIPGCSANHFVYADRTLGEQHYYNERTRSWTTLTLPLGSFAGCRGSDNVLLDWSSFSDVYAFSAQRGDVVAQPISGTLVQGPAALGDTAYFHDSSDTLHAFGSTAAAHQWHQYPLGSEFQVSKLSGASVPMRVGVRGQPGDDAWLLASARAPNFGGVSFPGITGNLYLTSIDVLLGSTPVGANGLTEQPIDFAVNLPPLCLQVWSQGLLFGAGGTPIVLPGVVPEPGWLF